MFVSFYYLLLKGTFVFFPLLLSFLMPLLHTGPLKPKEALLYFFLFPLVVATLFSLGSPLVLDIASSNYDFFFKIKVQFYTGTLLWNENRSDIVWKQSCVVHVL